MNKKNLGKASFVCASVVLGMWLQANIKNQPVLAAELENSNPTTEVVNQNQQEVKESTKVVIHYKGDSSKWNPYVWGKKPNGSGNQYNWNGEDEYGHYATITLDNDYDDVGILIKGKDNWDKDGQGNDRIVKVAIILKILLLNIQKPILGSITMVIKMLKR